MSKSILSVVIPVKNEEENVSLLTKKLHDVLQGMSVEYEIIYIDDGSTDKTYQSIMGEHKKSARVRYVKFTRNFGKAAALCAGFDLAKGNVIVTMDGDLQDDPNELPSFLKKLESGYDMVVGWKHKRLDSFAKTIPSKIFNWLVRQMTGIKLHDCDCGFKMFRAPVVSNMKLYGGLYRYIPVFAHAQGYRIGENKVRHHKRRFGKSKYGFGRLFGGALDLLTVKFLITYQQSPLHFFGGVGSLMVMVGVIFGIYLSILRFVYDAVIGNRPLLFLTVLLIFLGVQFISFGLVGDMMVFSVRSKNDGYKIAEQK